MTGGLDLRLDPAAVHRTVVAQLQATAGELGTDGASAAAVHVSAGEAGVPQVPAAIAGFTAAAAEALRTLQLQCERTASATQVTVRTDVAASDESALGFDGLRGRARIVP